MLRRTAAAMVAAAAAAACNPLGPVPADELESQIEGALASEYGVVPTVTCEEPLPAEAEAQIECVLRAPEAPETFFPVVVTVTEVDSGSGEVSFDIVVLDGPEDELSPEDLGFDPR
ncbi:uncharacterized protein DUF4333 [Bogoriella caseilytica]|uniref:Uncharacterized protein DUF4333 n=2 Tax=Bogoriella caseilytica TaxID=56055 RepID=A0A3N2B965_9MICO|nr:uncharacterized protein DUF4333 [Bogoriella caseilytica]